MFEKDQELKFNLNNPFSPHSIVSNLIKSEKEVLDVGCNTGYLGQYLIKNKNCICDGIDYNKQFLLKAQKRGYRNIYKIDLYTADFKLSEKYDVILFIDILEHLPDPYIILLKLIKENLKNKGTAIICLPNIGRFEYRIRHLLGKFNYEKSGIMHRDHLRFFTKSTALNMLKKTHLKIQKILPTGLGAKIKILTNLLSFQFIFVCQK